MLSTHALAWSLSKRNLLFEHCRSVWTRWLNPIFYAIIIILPLTTSRTGLPCTRVHYCKWACITVQLPYIAHSSAVLCACLPCDVRVCRVMCVHAVSWLCTAVWCPCNACAMTVHECDDRAVPCSGRVIGYRVLWMHKIGRAIEIEAWGLNQKL
jgi:hypothetical protein